MTGPASPHDSLMAALREYASLLQTKREALDVLLRTSEDILTSLRANATADIKCALERRGRECTRVVDICRRLPEDDAALIDAARQAARSTGGELGDLARRTIELHADSQALSQQVLASQQECESLLKQRLDATAQALRQSVHRRKLDAAYGPACQHDRPVLPGHSAVRPSRMPLCPALAVALVLVLTRPVSAAGSHYEQAMRVVRTLSDSPHVRLLKFGRSGSGRAIPAFAVSNFSTGPGGKARVLVCAGQHGDEFNAVESVLSLAQEIAADDYPDLLSGCIFVFAPAINPDGIAADHRLSADGSDINRDWLDLDTPEARYVNGIIRAWKPQVTIDAHEWTGETSALGYEIEVARCPSASQESAMTALAVRAGRSSGLSLLRCSPRCDPSLFHRRYSARGYAAYLLETPPDESLEVKDRAYKAAIITCASAAAENRDLAAALSPASKDFDPASVTACMEAPVTRRPVLLPSPALTATLLFLGAYSLLAWLTRPRRRQEEPAWQHWMPTRTGKRDPETPLRLAKHPTSEPPA